MILNQEKISIIREKIREYVLQSAYGSENQIQDSTLIFKEGFFDSMGFVMLISFLNDNFNITVSDNELIEENFESIDAITDFAGKKIN
jgi:acyl carrier protein